ncbi:MAG: type II secretion system secretin GspD [Pontiellaceae bacterium]|nr:type II secretion system secretin GspD [Pontiellaceae bacterium]
MKTICKIMLIVLPAVFASQTQAQEQLISLSFEDAPLEQAIDLYCGWTERTLIKQTDLSARITLKGRQLTQEEAKQAIETVLSINGIALIPMGEKFLKAVSIGSARQEGIGLTPFNPEQKYTEADQLISQVIPLRYVVFADVQPLIQSLIHGYGNIIEMTRINSILLTDTSANIARIVELINLVDQPAEKIEPRIYQLKYAEAATVSGKLRELIDAAKTRQGEQPVVVSNVRSIPGVMRAPRPGTGTDTAKQQEEQPEMIVGEVKLVSDDRTNLIIIFSKAANFDFFDNLIRVLDVPVDPAVVVEVINLEYAKAKDISSVLNEFVGAAKATEKSKAPGAGNVEGSKTVDEIVQRAESSGAEISADAKSAMGRLSADTKILSDERSNSLLLMGRKSDIAAIKEVIAGLDVMLEQVMIEAIILSVTLTDDLDTGIKWVYDSQMPNAPKQHVGNFIGTPTDITNSIISGLGSGMNYYGIFPKLDTKLLISASKVDSRTRILSTPVVMTTDNTEATITSGIERPVVSSSINSGGSSYEGYSARATYEYRNIGITLTVTPNINPQGFVVMEIKQTADDIDGELEIDGNKVPIISKREVSATVAVQDRSTVVLGGLVRKSTAKGSTKIPILGDIPLIGWLFSTHNNKDDRTELVVLLTPYVLTNPEQAQSEAKRRLESSDANETLWPRGWSGSPLKNDEPPKDPMKSKRDKKKNDKAEKEKAKTLKEVPPETSVQTNAPVKPAPSVIVLPLLPSVETEPVPPVESIPVIPAEVPPDTEEYTPIEVVEPAPAELIEPIHPESTEPDPEYIPLETAPPVPSK